MFEGIRGNWNEEQGMVNIFRLRERRLKLLFLATPGLRFPVVLVEISLPPFFRTMETSMKFFNSIRPLFSRYH